VTRNQADRRRAALRRNVRITRRPRHRAFPRNARAEAASNSSPSHSAPGRAPRRIGRTGTPPDRPRSLSVERACQGRCRTGKLRKPCSFCREGRELAGYKGRLLPMRRPASRPPSMLEASSCLPALPPPTKRITTPHSPLQPPVPPVCAGATPFHQSRSSSGRRCPAPPRARRRRARSTKPVQIDPLVSHRASPTLSPLTPTASSPESVKGHRRPAPGTQLRVP
jgi:hypothetical protein